MSRRRIAGVTLSIAALGLTACETTIDTADTTTPATSTPATGDSTATTIADAEPAGPDELGARLVAQSRDLSHLIVEGDGQHEALAELDAIWAELRPLLAETREDLLIDFDAAMFLIQTAVERRRPADADKASNNLATLVAAAGLT